MTYVPSITDDVLAEIEAAGEELSPSQFIEYNNDTGFNDEYFVEWWEPADSIRCYDEHAAKQVHKILLAAPGLIARLRESEARLLSLCAAHTLGGTELEREVSEALDYILETMRT